MVNPFIKKISLLYKRGGNIYVENIDAFICGINQDWLKSETDP